ncbi:fibrinogen beta chain-like isoform X2 [Actinia tenebrosa]|uniref:Fibrinogen beta chain-like isoform X2 n=1 Tax=Actinia tenebrosa TaxID=6105 RepID=A0A6P8J1X2_ACTTE|nr:fibrinogen beta chain-like isoform X2 [Actinia tenebrosa]
MKSRRGKRISNNKCQLQEPCSANTSSCLPEYDTDGYRCKCKSGIGGEDCQKICKDCSQLHALNFTSDGVYFIDPDGLGAFPVYCNMTNGGWTLFQKRFDGSVRFNRKWQEYKTGFGNVSGEFWLGFDKILRLLRRPGIPPPSLLVDVENWNGDSGYSEYSTFSIANESDSYRLTVSGYSGTAGDSLSTASSSNSREIHSGMQFSTSDNDNDMADPNWSCAIEYEGPWWHNNCGLSHLNGRYEKDTINSEYKVMYWWSLKSNYAGIRKSEMKLK